MALQSNDLFVIQSQTDSQLYKLRLSDLDAYLEGSSGVQFRGSVDLNNSASAQTPAVTLPAANGDLYIVESDANPINADWIMDTGVTTANENDRIIWDADGGYWVLVAGGSSTGGTVTDITATLPLETDGDSVTPVLTINQARTQTAATNAADGKGTAGAVAKLAEAADVAHTVGTGDTTAVVTADLLKATNEIVEGLAVAAGGVTTVTTADANGNSALSVSPTSGNVVIEIETADDSTYGVVQIANASDITNGTAGASAVVDAAQLKAVADEIDALDTGVTSVSTTDANGNGALSLSPTTGAVVAEIATGSSSTYGVVQVASASDITNGTSGGGAVVDASQLKAAVDALPQTAVNSVTEGGTDIVTGALQIATDANEDVTIGVNEETFAPYDFSSLTDITTI